MSLANLKEARFFLYILCSGCGVYMQGQGGAPLFVNRMAEIGSEALKSVALTNMLSALSSLQPRSSNSASHTRRT